MPSELMIQMKKILQRKPLMIQMEPKNILNSI